MGKPRRTLPVMTRRDLPRRCGVADAGAAGEHGTGHAARTCRASVVRATYYETAASVATSRSGLFCVMFTRGGALTRQFYVAAPAVQSPARLRSGWLFRRDSRRRGVMIAVAGHDLSTATATERAYALGDGGGAAARG